MTRSQRRSTQSGANDSREKMQACAGSTSSRRKPHASRVHSLCSSRPTWQRHTTRAPRSSQGTGEPGRLRVVEEDDVAGLHPRDHLLALPRQRGVVRRPRGGVEPPCVTGDAVQPVVDPLGDGEELGVTAHHQPADVDPVPAGVRHEGAQHLRDAAAARGRVDVPHDAPVEQDPRRGDVGLEPFDALGREEGLEPLQGHRLDADLRDAGHRV